MKSLLTLIAITITGCGIPFQNSDDLQRQATEKVQSQLNSQLGLPNVVNGQEKRLVKELYEIRDQANLATYTYTISEMSGTHTFLGRSIGFGIPASVQYSNPEREARVEYALPQAEPNGLFMPDSLAATWVYLIAPDGEAQPTYVEACITVSLFPLINAAYPATGAQYADLVSK